MEEKNLRPDHERGNPEKVYREELHNEGSSLMDTPSESEARDKAKVEKVLSGDTQKMDTVSPDDLQDDVDNEAVRRETLENK